MSYVALYRKFRPPVWEDVKGQDHIVTTLRNQLNAGRVGHAYLFCGTRGTGKTSVAKILARAVNCPSRENGNPCNECESCKTALQGNNMNVIEIDAASNNKVEDARTLIEEVGYPPVRDPRKVYIIDEAHMLTKEAFNALLKTIEEPPEHAIFILATTEVQDIPVTILSRCQRYDFHRITSGVIAKRLKEVARDEGLDADAAALDYIARVSDGALRDGLSLLDQCTSFYAGEALTLDKVLDVLGAADTGVFASFFDMLVRGDVSGAVLLLDDIAMQGKELSQFVSDFIWYLRNLMLAQTSQDVSRVLDMSAEHVEELKKQALSSDPETVMRMIRLFSETHAQMRHDMQKRTLLEMTVVRVCRPSAEEGAASLEARLSALESREERVMRALEAIESGRFRIAEEPASSGGEEAGTQGGGLPPRRTIDAPQAVREIRIHWDEFIPSLPPVLKNCLQSVTKDALSCTDDGKLIIGIRNRIQAGMLSDDNLEELKTLLSERAGGEVDIVIEPVGDMQDFMQTHPDISDKINISVQEETEDE